MEYLINMIGIILMFIGIHIIPILHIIEIKKGKETRGILTPRGIYYPNEKNNVK